MTKVQLVILLLAAALFAGLYWGFDTKPSAQKTLERSRALQAESTSPDQLINDARAHLSAEQAVSLALLEQQLTASQSDAQKIAALKALSRFWYTNNAPAASGILAEQVAGLENTDTSWSVAGATFFNALTLAQDPILRRYCADHALKAFESAASLNTTLVEHRVNQALVYAEQPPADNPMQAVLLLRDLEAKYPDEPSVYNALGRLAIKTGQWDRAVQRLEKALELEPNNSFTPCLLAKAYAGAGQTDKANTFANRCNGGS